MRGTVRTFVTLLAGVALVASCGSPVAVEALHLDVEVAIHPNPLSVSESDSSFITVRVRNPANRPVSVYLGEKHVLTGDPATSSNIAFRIRMLDEGGEPQGGSRSTWGQPEVLFQAGEVKEHTFALEVLPVALENYYGVDQGDVWVWPSFGRFLGDPAKLTIVP